MRSTFCADFQQISIFLRFLPQDNVPQRFNWSITSIERGFLMWRTFIFLKLASHVAKTKLPLKLNVSHEAQDTDRRQKKKSHNTLSKNMSNRSYLTKKILEDQPNIGQLAVYKYYLKRKKVVLTDFFHTGKYEG